MPQDLVRDSFFDQEVGQPRGEDRGAFVRFYKNKVSDKTHCRIEFAGDKQTVWDQPVREQDKRNYWQQWNAYQQGLDQSAGQTLLDAWSDIDPGSVEIYKSLHIMTVEQLAHLTDQNLSNFDPGHVQLAVKHRAMAQKYLAEREKSAGFDKAMGAAEDAAALAANAVSENEELKVQIAEMQRRMAEMDTGRSVEALQTPESAHFPVYVEGHGRGAIYRLSNGKTIKGKRQAIEAERKLAA